MGKRSTGRKLAMQALYQCHMRGVSTSQVLEEFLTDADYPDITKAWAVELAGKAWEKHAELDTLIEKYSENWELHRINPVDLSVMRLALYEMRFTDTAPSVVINEAIELVKKFSDEDSPKFVNGILGNYVKKECLPV